MLGRGWQKIDGTALSPFSKGLVPLYESLVAFWLVAFWLVACVFFLRLLTWAGLCAYVAMGFHSSWILLVNIFEFFLNTCNGP